MPANCTGNGPYSKRVARGLLDGRSANGRYVRHFKSELKRELGREPTFMERMLIEQTAIIALQLAEAAKKVDAGEVLGPHANHQLVAWHNAFRRNLVELGLGDAPADAQPDPAAALTRALADIGTRRLANESCAP